jgi:hypothetical protein
VRLRYGRLVDPVQQQVEPNVGVVVGVHPEAEVVGGDGPAPRGDDLGEERLVALGHAHLQQVAVLRLLRREHRLLVGFGRAEEEAVRDARGEGGRVA